MIEVLASWIITTGLSYVVVRVDERFSSEDRLERAWPPSSRDAAIFAFGLLALPIHFVKTCGHVRSLRGVLGFALGLLIGALAFLAVAFASGLLVDGVAALCGLPSR